MNSSRGTGDPAPKCQERRKSPVRWRGEVDVRATLAASSLDGYLVGNNLVGLGSLWAVNRFEGHTLPFGKRPMAAHLNRREVDEEIAPSVVGRNEAVAPIRVKPFYST